MLEEMLNPIEEDVIGETGVEVIRTSLREFFIKMIRIIVVKIMMMKTIRQWRL